MNYDKTAQTYSPRQEALFKTAKVGDISSMKQFIEAGADPYMPDEQGLNAVFYATLAAPEKIDLLAPLLKKIILQRGGSYGE